MLSYLGGREWRVKGWKGERKVAGSDPSTNKNYQKLIFADKKNPCVS